MTLGVKNVTIFALILLILLILIKVKCNTHEGFQPNVASISNTNNNMIVPDMKRPFVNIFDQKGRKLNVILISKPFSGDTQQTIYLKNKKNNIFIGVTSYLEFPNMVSNPYEDFTENYKKYKYKECKYLHLYAKKSFFLYSIIYFYK